MPFDPRVCRPSIWVLVLCFVGSVLAGFAAGTAAISMAGTLHDALVLARQDKTADPVAVQGFQRLAREYGTPLYVYDKAILDEQAQRFKNAFVSRFANLRLFFAVKANTSLALISLLRGHGYGTEVVSGGEIQTALHLGVPGSEIMYTSSSKSPWEIDLALREGVLINVDSLDELDQIEVAAARLKKTARISFRINPGVDPHTIHQINTGITESKFGLHLQGGIALQAYERALKRPHVKVAGLHCHIGSQITDPEGYRLAAEKMMAFALELQEKLGVRLEFIDLGGGVGIPYQDGQTTMTPDDLAATLEPIWRAGVEKLGYEPTLWLEPGRYLVAPAGFLLTRVNSVKTTPVKTFVNINAGFNTLVRPAMYQAYHRVRAIGATGPLTKVDIAGDVCETGDILATDRELPKPRAGDLVVLLDAGAYGFAMASEYNARPLPAEVLVDGDSVTVIRERARIDDLFRRQHVPGERRQRSRRR